ncbi:hypothetical protein MAR_024522 [Mya arenaria]|uniref:Chitin-binding type-4 domain-containing protein n=1 Tax=Mya arenaria TaxID=6604 RepID=A0ABY7DRY2_MYAAR|nr:hypothetical protein MAR_024522 [Mya arenaria]
MINLHLILYSSTNRHLPVMLPLRGLLVILALAVMGPKGASGHGRMVEPAARNAMWRLNYKNPRNYNDMGLNCGGFTNQFERQGGQCGVCGDRPEGPRDHEAGGKYARGVIARQYKVGAFINVTVELTSNHQGYFEFRLCPVNDPRKKATHACLDRHLLNIVGHGTRYFITVPDGSVVIELMSMGPDGYGGECLGCGNQEHFINCADVAIGPNAVSPLPPLAPGITPPAAPAPAPAVAAPNTNYVAAGPTYNVQSASDTQMDTGVALMKHVLQRLLHAQKKEAATQPWAGLPAAAPIAPTNQWNPPAPQPTWQQAQTPTPWQAPTPAPWKPTTSRPWHQSDSSNTEVNYPGYEPGEYPEQGESPSSGSSQGSQNELYIKGYNDALKQFQKSFGMPGLNIKSNAPFNEASLAFQESQKNIVPSYGGSSSGACPDGSEFECRATNTLQGTDFDSFCQGACVNGQCPTDLCACTCPGGTQGWSGAENSSSGGANCRGVDRSKGSAMDRWCTLNCQQNNCPSSICTCS